MSDPGSTMRHHGQDRDRLTVVGFDEISWLRGNSPAWRLLRAENAPLVLSFLDQVFVAENIRSISAAELANRLDDELYALNERLGERAFPKPAKAYLDDWAAPEAGWLRKYYPEGSDEPHFDVTPAVEKALAWVRGLQARSFVGTESRLNTVFLLLRQMAFGAETDPDERLSELSADGRSWTTRSRGSRPASLTCSKPRLCGTATSSSPLRPANCSPISARWRRTSGSWTATCGKRSRPGTGPRASSR